VLKTHDFQLPPKPTWNFNVTLKQVLQVVVFDVAGLHYQELLHKLDLCVLTTTNSCSFVYVGFVQHSSLRVHKTTTSQKLVLYYIQVFKFKKGKVIRVTDREGILCVINKICLVTF
jgi:hypothetical protein